MKKRFDRAWHPAILNKLLQAGVSTELVNWLRSYLTQRRIRVRVGGNYSQWYEIESGVPQGAVIAPLLFLVFINDLPQNLESHTRMFADDTSISAFMSSFRATESETIQKDLDEIYNWRNLVKFNSDKVIEILITRSTDRAAPPLRFDSDTIKQVQAHKHLGLIFQQDLKWESHCAQQLSKMHKAVNYLKPLKHQLDRRVLVRIYKTYIRPIPIDEYMTPFPWQATQLPNETI